MGICAYPPRCDVCAAHGWKLGSGGNRIFPEFPQFLGQGRDRRHQRGPEHRFEASGTFGRERYGRLAVASGQIMRAFATADPCGIQGIRIKECNKPLIGDGLAAQGIGDAALRDAEQVGHLGLRAQARGLQDALVCGLKIGHG